MAKREILTELNHYLWSNKTYWLAPIVAALILVGLLLVLTEGSAVSPFIYTLF
jgi:hypothetical protein